MKITFLIIAGIIFIVGIAIIAIYNSLITLRNRTKEAWSDIDVQLKRRHDLIPNLVESVKGYMKHEKDLLENVAKYRSQAMAAQKSGDTALLAGAESMLSGALGKIQIALEAYPDLKANTSVMQLMDELSDTENKIQASRRFYNGNVRDFNTKLQVFPTNFFARMMSFTPFSFFEITDASERENVSVKF